MKRNSHHILSGRNRRYGKDWYDEASENNRHHKWKNPAGLDISEIEKLDSLPKQSAMIPRGSWNDSFPHDHALLKRFVKSHTGQPAQSFHEKVTRNTDCSSHRQSELRQDVLNCVLPAHSVSKTEDGIINRNTGWSPWQVAYIDPDTGRLEKMPARAASPRQLKRQWIDTDDPMIRLVPRKDKRGNIQWYIAELQQAPESKVRQHTDWLFESPRSGRHHRGGLERVISYYEKRSVTEEYFVGTRAFGVNRSTVIDAQFADVYGRVATRTLDEEEFAPFKGAEPLPWDVLLPYPAFAANKKLRLYWGIVNGKTVYAASLRAANSKEIARWITGLESQEPVYVTVFNDKEETVMVGGEEEAKEPLGG